MTSGEQNAPGEVQSVMRVGRENDLRADEQVQSDGATNVWDRWFPGPDENRLLTQARQRTAAFAAQQAQQLSEDLDTQSAPGFSGTNYASYSATQLKQMLTSNMDPATAGDAASSWTDMGNSYVEISQSLSKAVGDSQFGWRGAAGDATREFMSGISKWAATAGQGAQLAGNRLAVQSEAASTAKNSVPTNPTEPPTGSDIAKTMLQSGLNPAAGAQKLNAQFAQAAADHIEAVQAAQRYDSSLATAGEKFPAFATPPTFSPHAGGTVTGPSGGSGVSSLSGSARVLRTHSPAGRSGASSPTVRGGSSTGSSRPPSGTQPPPQLTSPNNSMSTSGFEPGPATPVPTNPQVNPNQLVDGPTGPGWGQSPTVDPTFSGKLFGPDGGGGGGFGSTGGGSVPFGSEGEVSGGRVGGVSGGSGSGVGEPGGRRLGGGAAAGEEGVVEDRVGSARGAGEPGAGMMPRGAKGKGGEDSEHKRASYLNNPDPEKTFGTDERVAPPTIGE